MSCNVCDGTPGFYPIMDKFGRQLYEIACPECEGSGLSEEEADLEARQTLDRLKYDAAMAEMRANQTAHEAVQCPGCS